MNLTVGDVIEQSIALLNSVYGLPGHVLVGLTCVILGYMLRFYRKFPNDAIPLVCILWGMVFNPLLADERVAGSSMRLWLVRNVLTGFVTGAVAWAIHAKIIKRFEERIPLLGSLLTAADKRSDETQVANIMAKETTAAIKADVVVTKAEIVQVKPSVNKNVDG